MHFKSISKASRVKRFSSLLVMLLVLTACSEAATPTPAIITTKSVNPVPTVSISNTVVVTTPALSTPVLPTPISAPVYNNLEATLNGSGSSLVDPIMQPWVQLFATIGTKVKISYKSIGSGSGRQDFFAGKTDFADSDVPASASEIVGKPDLLYIPMTLAGVVIAFNLPDVGNLNLDAATVAKMFTGKITMWNDPAIVALNPSAKLPAVALQFAVRQDASGTTQVFTTYLSSISDDFKNSVGSSSQPDWSKAGLKVAAAPQNDGVTSLLKQNIGTIGYVEATYALENKLPYARLQNAAGNFVEPTLDNLTAAAQSVKPNSDLTINLINQPSNRAWPITTTTYVIIYRDQKDMAKAQALVAFLYWCTHEGQNLAPSLDYARLPLGLVRQIEANLLSVTVNGQQVVFVDKIQVHPH